MRYLQVVTQMESGGAQKVAMLLSEGIKKQGYDSEVWYLYQKRPTYADDPSVRVMLAHPPKNILDYIRIIFNFAFHLLKHRPDYVISHTYYSNIISLLFSYLFLIKNRIAVQHYQVEYYPKLAKVIDKILGTVGVYTKNIVVSKAVENSVADYPKRYKNRIKLIYNGCKVTKPTINKREVRNMYGIPHDAPLLVNVGRLSYAKNQSILIKIMSEQKHLHLCIVGDGELKESLKKEAEQLECESRVHFTGELSAEMVANVVHASDIFMFPSLYESFGMVLVEAMLYKIPVVASSIPSTIEVIGHDQDDDKHGILANEEDMNSFIIAIQRILEDPEHANKMVTAAFKRAQNYHINTMVHQYVNL